MGHTLQYNGVVQPMAHGGETFVQPMTHGESLPMGHGLYNNTPTPWVMDCTVVCLWPMGCTMVQVVYIYHDHGLYSDMYSPCPMDCTIIYIP